MAVLLSVSLLFSGCNILKLLGFGEDEKDSGGSGKRPVVVVAMNTDNLVLGVGDYAVLTALVFPANASDKSVTWASDNVDVATVDAKTGAVTGVAAGSAAITVTTVTGGKTATCAVTVVPAVYTIAKESEWTAALEAISNAEGGTPGSPVVFALQITGDFSAVGTTSGSTVTGADKEVRLTGTNTISLAGQGSLIRTAENQTFVIDGPALEGITDNNHSLVSIGSGSAVELASGAINGNVNKSSNGSGDYTRSGGGVFVDVGGTFTMKEGGTISRNTAENGGGVYVRKGTFTMDGGTIENNTATASFPISDGGGVYVDGDGTFMMNNGTISGNEANRTGGGVRNYGTFTMNAGTITGNTATGYNGGGGVSNVGTFTMNAGAITGNTATATGYGGGGVSNVGTFTINAGTIITENKAISSKKGVSGTITSKASGAVVQDD